MALSKVTYVDGVTIIGAKNLNDIQDNIITLQADLDDLSEEIDVSVRAWLDEHPEATTTVVDGSLTYKKLVTGTLGFVTPEMFGAIGNGDTDDTEAWQAAVNVGLPVKATSKSYKCGKIDVTKNIEIDCNDADFICTDTILFNCTGVVDHTIKSAEYNANDAIYSITAAGYTDYTGFAFVKGTNHFLTSRTYYYGGFSCQFRDGQMLGAMPVSANDGEGTVDIDLITPITVRLSNIGNIAHTANGNCTSIKISYGLNCLVENINNRTFSTYCCIDFEGCLSCKAINLNIVGFLGTTGTNSYIVAFSDSSFCSVEGSHLYNKYWHCVTTGANYLCWKNSIIDCVLLNDTGGALVDHDNGIGTFVKNCVVEGLVIGGCGIVEDTKIISNGGSGKQCWLTIQICTAHELTGATVKNIEIIPDSETAYNGNGINITSYPQETGKTFYADNIFIENVRFSKHSVIKFGFNGDTDSYWIINNIVLKDIRFENSGYLFFGNTGGNIDQSDSRIILDNVYGLTLTTLPQIGSALGQFFGNVTILHSKLHRISGKYDSLALIDTYVKNSISNASAMVKTFRGSNIQAPFYDSFFITGDNDYKCYPLQVTDAQNPSGKPIYNLGGTSATAKYYQIYENGALVTKQFAVS